MSLGNANPMLKRTFEDYGINEADWDTLRAITPWKPQADSAGTRWSSGRLPTRYELVFNLATARTLKLDFAARPGPSGRVRSL
jgi:hypothetical protein